MQTAPYGGAQVCAWTCKTPLKSVGATARRHHPNPAEAHRRWRAERSKPVRLGVRDHHTRSVCAESPAQTEQWCCWLCRRGIIFGPTCARGRGMLAAGPELRITGAAAQTRMVSVARIRLVSRESTRLFKGIICDDISEFESYMPSHAVGLRRPCLGCGIMVLKQLFQISLECGLCFNHRIERLDHSITSSARASSVGGTVRPSAFAVFMLITNSYLVGACTGRSAGFSPLRMRSTYPAASRYWSTS